MTKSTTRKQYVTEFKEATLRLARKIGVTKAAKELCPGKPMWRRGII